ncbi:MAG: pyruvate kinase [Deltaproteobacteria bacterium]|nr:pyruvate kinase [Deltaproteobacteria bacterium]
MNFGQFLKYWTLQAFAPGKLLHHKYAAFKELLRHDKRSLELITELEEIRHGGMPVDWARVSRLVRALNWSVGGLIRSLRAMHPLAYGDLEQRFAALESSLLAAISLPRGDGTPPYALTLMEAAEAPALAGGKAQALGRVLRETKLPVPRGFVITTRAFHLFLAHNSLWHRLEELLSEARPDHWERLQELSREMTAMVLEGEIPSPVRREIRQRLSELKQEGVSSFSLRSSAVGEDGEASFAGQYASVLQVPAEAVLAAYKEVLAGKYAPRAVAYRIRQGLAEEDTSMAVLVMEMIEARVSGVIYTRDRPPGGEVPEAVAVYAVPGPGRRLVDGSAEPEVHYFTREPEPRLLQSIPGRACAAEFPGKGCLAPETAALLAAWGLRLEELAACPQDIEWCQDRLGACYILQTRPLVTEDGSFPGEEAREMPSVRLPVLLEEGDTASPGVATGRVYVLRSEAELGEVPEGAVLVCPTLSPSLAGVVGRLRAVVAESGSRASHFASVAREFGLPVLAAASGAARRLTPGQVVTVDADRGRIYQGERPGPARELQGAATRPGAPFWNRLHRVMELVAPLHLLDPASPEFSPAHCASAHDFVRFAHEKGMAEMFSLVGRSGRGLGRARQLTTDLPITIYVLDLEGGVAPEAADKKTIEPRHITSPLMRACWEGLTHPEVTWQKGLVHLDWEEMDRISAGIVSFKSPRLASYAVVAQEYLHLVLRFGYHFAVLDALCGEDSEANYLTFRFKGGGADYDHRLRRVRLIRDILEWAGFTVQTRGDLLDARFARRPAAPTLARLTLLGILQGKTQLLDMALDSELQVEEMAADFKARFGRYAADAEMPERGDKG